MSAMLRVIHGFKSGPQWLVFCDVCDDFPFSIRPIRTSARHDLAVAWAHEHARKHLAAQCPTCQRMGRIEDDTKKVTVRATSTTEEDR